jgi:protein-tyrosine phosphatase
MYTQLYWIDGPWPGRLALAARPRGGDWLPDEIAAWRKAGIDVIVSLLTRGENSALDLELEVVEAARAGMTFIGLPIEDRSVPPSDSEVASTLSRLDGALSSGKNAVIHCRQGVGRTGLIAAALLISKGMSADEAINALSAARGVAVPETAEQRRWIDHYGAIAA